MRRSAFQLVEILVAVSILAVASGPLIYSMVLTKKSAFSTSHDVQAIQLGSSVVEVLAGLPYPALPQNPTPDDLVRFETLELEGLPRESWNESFRPEPGAPSFDWEAAIPRPSDPGHELFLWFEPAQSDLGLSSIQGVRATVGIRYQASGPNTRKAREYALRAVFFPDPEGEP